jgi:uncharacterized protein
MQDLLVTTLRQVVDTFARNWPYLLIGAIVAAGIKVYANPEIVRRWMTRYRSAAVFAATGLSVATPLCSCGTTAVILGMMASSLPWAPIVAFMVASPLTSPQELIYSAGLFGWPFALAFLLASILLGLAGGFFAHLLEARGWLAGQARFRAAAGGSVDDAPDGSSPAAAPLTLTARELVGRGLVGRELVGRALVGPKLAAFGRELWLTGRRLLLLFFLFAFAGYFLNNLMPAHWVSTLFGEGMTWGVPLAATLGLPLYVNTEASLPMVRAFLDGGASAGAALAFLISGAGTSLGAISGALAMARWRIVGLVVAVLWGGAIAAGYLYNALLGLFPGVF